MDDIIKLSVIDNIKKGAVQMKIKNFISGVFAAAIMTASLMPVTVSADEWVKTSKGYVYNMMTAVQPKKAGWKSTASSIISRRTEQEKQAGLKPPRADTISARTGQCIRVNGLS